MVLIRPLSVKKYSLFYLSLTQSLFLYTEYSVSRVWRKTTSADCLMEMAVGRWFPQCSS